MTTATQWRREKECRESLLVARDRERREAAFRIAERRAENERRAQAAHERAMAGRIQRGPSGHRIGESHGRAAATDATVERARQLREELGWTYRRIGEELGVHWRTVADWCQYRCR